MIFGHAGRRYHRALRMKAFAPLLLLPLLVPGGPDATPLARALRSAEEALAQNRPDEAHAHLQRAFERDPGSRQAWALRARWAEAGGNRDELAFALHRLLRLSIAQRVPREEARAIRQRLEAVDPVAPDLLKLRDGAIKRLALLAQGYEKERRPHSAIRVHQEILAFDPEREESRATIQRLSAAPDPSLAETAQARDLLADVSAAWIEEHDKQHADWESRATLERENYVTHTDAGWEVLVRAAEAMEQMNAFYRVFFRYGTGDDKHSVPRIELHIFRDRDEYLKLGRGPPAEWSGGQFTGGAVETFVGTGGFEGMVGTLFHEAAHQFVSLATRSAGWLNEGLASFFEGTRILANGTVRMNLPANHRLFPLVDRMTRGWMTGPMDGIDAANPSGSDPPKAPTFRIVIENEYSWGPPWYAPTWGVVYFLYNYQDPADGRFVYRNSFREYVNASGGKTGKTAIATFEKVVLGSPEKPTPGFEGSSVDLPRTVDQLSDVWRRWLTDLRDEQAGTLKVQRPRLAWARAALQRKDMDAALEHFEKGMIADPSDVDLLVEFAELLAGRGKNPDRAGKLVLQALRVVETEAKPDPKRIDRLEGLLRRWDERRPSLQRIHADVAKAAGSIIDRYLGAGLDLMAMETSWRFGNDLGLHELFAGFEEAVRRSGKTLALWQLAYNERDLKGWAAAGVESFVPDGDVLRSRFLPFDAQQFDYQFLTMDKVTSGDFSFEAEVASVRGKNVFCGLVFGRKSTTDFHGLIYFPGAGPEATAGSETIKGFVDLTSFYGSSSNKIWRHNPVDSSRSEWHTLRVDVAGRLADVWFDGELVVSQEFPSLDVLRGSFGLITGRGEARFRNVRYLAREPRDPGAVIERKVRMEKLAASAKGPRASFLGAIPPWPVPVAWLREPRRGWQDFGPQPVLVVLWSRKQNETIPLHQWLADLQKRTADIRLQFLCVAENGELPPLEEYVKSKPFPGSVLIDQHQPWKAGFGETFDAYSIGSRYNLPRLLLLDVDHRVVWEGDPGFPPGHKWKPGEEDYLKTPLEELERKRNLRRLYAWLEEWPKLGPPALGEGDLAAALPLLQEARTLPGELFADVDDARLTLSTLEGAAGKLLETAQELAGRGREPAVRVLLRWVELVGKPADEKPLRAVLERPNVAAWEEALALARAADPSRMEPLFRGLEGLSGPFVGELEKALRAAAGDAAATRRVLDEAGRAPARWLAREWFGW